MVDRTVTSMRKGLKIALIAVLPLGIAASVLVGGLPTPDKGTPATVTKTVGIPAAFTACGADLDCATAVLTGELTKNGIAPTLALYAEIVEKTNGFNGLCQPLGRKFGSAVFQKYGMESLEHHEDACGLAYISGVMTAYGNQPDIELDAIRSYCEADQRTGPCFYSAGLAQRTSAPAAAEVFAGCETIAGKYDSAHPEVTVFQYTGIGGCVLGWVSGKLEMIGQGPVTAMTQFVSVCEGLPAAAKPVCMGEATFAYTYTGVNGPEERLPRLAEVRKRCDTDTSAECMIFVGKGIDDYILYGIRADLNDPTQLAKAVAPAVDLCTGERASLCAEGLVQAHMTHTSPADAALMCPALPAGQLRDICTNQTKRS